MMRLLRNRTLWLVGTQAFAAFSALVVNIFSTSALDPSSRGYLAFYLQLAFICQFLALFGRDRAALVVSGINGDFSVSRFLIGANRTGVLLVGVLGIVVTSAGVLGGEQPLFLLALSLWFACAGIFGVVIRVRYVLEPERGLIAFAATSIVVQILLIVGSFCLMMFEVTDLNAWVGLYPSSASVYVLVAAWAALRDPRPPAPRASVALISKEGWRLFPLSMLTLLLQKADRLLLPVLSTGAELGRYVFVVSILELASWPIVQWLDTKLASWRREYEARGLIRLRAVIIGSIGVSSLLASFAALFSQLYIAFALTEEYASASLLIVPIAAAVIVRVGSRVFSGVLVAQKMRRLALVGEFLALGAFIVGLVVLAPSLGALGAAYASLGAAVISLFFLSVGFCWRRRQIGGSSQLSV